jgi:RimJ/RimL family protein N-acetyltransferase
MLDISRLSSTYEVRRMHNSDADDILELCRENEQFYRYCEAKPEREQILNDLKITPPGIRPSDKYYAGFFQDGELVAVMDLIDGYPKPENAYIGFFMMNQEYQGQQIGSAIIGDTAGYLRKIGNTAIRLAIDKGNPQSAHFWKKNGFKVILEVDENL